MASEVDISNLALSMLGEEAEISSLTPPDSVLAGYCKRFYPMARDALLEQHAWTFATSRKALALLSLDDMPVEWAYAYARPNCLKVLAVYAPMVAASTAPAGAIFNQQEFLKAATAYPFLCESLESGEEVIYSNVEDATALFIRRVTDTSKFRPLVVNACARLLAAYLAGTVIKGKEGMNVSAKQLEWFEKVDAPRAKGSDAQNSHNTSYDTFTPSSIKARQ